MRSERLGLAVIPPLRNMPVVEEVDFRLSVYQLLAGRPGWVFSTAWGARSGVWQYRGGTACQVVVDGHRIEVAENHTDLPAVLEDVAELHRLVSVMELMPGVGRSFEVDSVTA